MPVLNTDGIFLSVSIVLKIVVITGTISGFPALKGSNSRPYSSVDFPVFN